MFEKEIEIHTVDGIADGFLYHPDGAGPWPGVLHLTDIGGIREVSRQISKQLVSLGYAVLMPNVFYRTAKPPLWAFQRSGDEKSKKRFQELASPLTPDAVERDSTPYIDFLAKQDGVKQAPFGIAGYCITGGIALRMAAAHPEKIAAVTSFHAGGLFTDAPTSPHLVLPRVKARLYFGHAEEDYSMPKEAIEKFERALAAWGGQYESETYAGAHHGWTMSDGSAYNEPQAERALAKLAELFAATLGGKNASGAARSA